jgi:hypothetical protein
MASIDKTLQESCDQIEGAFRRFYNYHQLSLYKKKSTATTPITQTQLLITSALTK